MTIKKHRTYISNILEMGVNDMRYNIPLFDLNFGKEEEEAVLETLQSKWISTGPKTIEFEKKFSEKLKINYAVALSNCTAALHLAVKILEIKENDEVIVPSLTFVATANVIRYLGAIPVFCDVKSTEDLTIDPEMVERLITSKTKAIMVMHYAGFPANMDKIMNIAKKYNLKVIEDACHGPLSVFKGKKLGTIGDIGCFSFFSNKNMSTGEGGMLVTNNEEYYKKALLLRSHGMTTMSYERAKGHSTSYDVIEFGYNYRMDDIHSSIGIIQLEKLEEDLKKRIDIRNYYIERLSKINDIVIPFREHNGFVSNYIFPIVLKNSTVDKRDFIRKHLQDKGIQTSVHYPALHRFSIYKDKNVHLPNTEYVTDNEVTLPMYGSLTYESIEYISNILKEVLSI